MTFRKIILFLLISFSLVANVQARMPTERPASTSASIFELPPFERAVCCIRFYEGMHRAKEDKYGVTASQYRIQSVPTLMLFRNGEVLWRTSGVVDKAELLATLDPFLK